MQETIAGTLARFVAECDLETVPLPVIERAKLYCLDTLTVALAGAGVQSSQIVGDVVEALGGIPDCTLIGRSSRSSVALAALANGVTAHAIELDDDHRTSVLHPGTVVVPAALAMAEHCRASGKALLEGIIVGYELMTRIGDAFLGRQYYEGFHSTGTCGVFGAAAAGRILGLSAERLTATIGIAGTQASGLGEWKTDGSWIKRLHPGKAAESGVLAALLARQGFSGPSSIIEGEHGFLKAFSHERVWDSDKILAGLGREYRGHGTSFKPYACCRFSHQVVDAALAALTETGASAGAVNEVRVRIHTTAYEKLFEPGDIRYHPKTVVDAQFSIPFILAVAILYGRPMPWHFTEATIRSPEILALAARIRGTADREYENAYPSRYPTLVTLCLRDGREISSFRDLPSGDPENPSYREEAGLLEREVIDKFSALMQELPEYASRRDAILSEAMRLERAPSVADLARLFAP